MSRKVLIIDTSVLCIWLGVPGMETCGPNNDRWDAERVKRLIEEAEAQESIFILPLATITETGNHIAHTRHYAAARKLADLMVAAADAATPWAQLTRQVELWDTERIKQLAEDFPKLATQGIGIGDASIERLSHYYDNYYKSLDNLGYEVKIETCDAALKAREPAPPLKAREPSVQPARRDRRHT